MSAGDWERRYRLSGRGRDLVRWIEALHEEGACTRAIEVLEAESPRFPAESVRWTYLRARCLFDTGQTEAARQELDALLEQQPDHGKALELRYRVALREQDTRTASQIRERLEVLGWDPTRLRETPTTPPAAGAGVRDWNFWVQQAQSIDSWLASVQNDVEHTPDVVNFLRLAEQEG